jgi:hypothetical protein
VAVYSKPVTAERCPMNCDYEGFEIESFEVGRGLWHARFRRADHEPVIIDGVLLPALNVGFAWPDPDTAVADAKLQIDHLSKKIVLGAAVYRTQG